MKKASIRNQLNEILENKRFEELSKFSDDASWKGLRKPERELLASLFLMAGERQLREGHRDVWGNLEKAQKLAPKSAELLQRQGQLLVELDAYPKACLAFKEAADLDEEQFLNWFGWGKALLRSGVQHRQQSDLHDAQEKFSRAAALVREQEELLPELFWEWGLSFLRSGELSGEAVDYHAAIEKFKKAVDLGVELPDFYKDFGDAFCELGHLIGRHELVQEGASFYEAAVAADPEYMEGWLSLGCSVGKLYEWERQDEQFTSAFAAFQKASVLDGSNFLVWLQWGRLLVSAAKLNRDPSLFQLAVERFERAAEVSPDDPLLLRQWAEASILWGGFTDRLELMREGERRIHESLRQQPHDPDGWYVLGVCLSELGRYFNDETYYRQAIDKFEFGLKQDPKALPLWYGLAQAHYGLGETTDDVDSLKASVRICERVMELGGDRQPQYWNDWGVCLMKLAELTHGVRYVEEAVQRFETAVVVGSESEELDPEWKYNLGCSLDFLGDFTDSDKAYRRAIQLLKEVLDQDPDYAPANYNLALALSHLGELTGEPEHFEEALLYFEDLSELEDEDELLYADWGLALLNLAQVLEDPDFPEKAAEYREQAESKLVHAVSLGSLPAYYNLACLYSLTANYELSMQFLRRAEKVEALPTIEELMSDEWLRNLRDTQVFRDFMEELLERDET